MESEDMKENYKNIYRAIDYAENHLKESIQVSQLAEEASLSLFHFTRLFKTVTGESPSAYVRKRKLSEAGKAISENKEILNTALDFGWNSQESFTQSFKAYFGLAPGQMRKNKVKLSSYLQPLKSKERYIIMTTNQIQKLENLAQQIYTLGLFWSHEALNLGPQGRGIAVVASETKKLNEELITLIWSMKENLSETRGEDLELIAEKMKILTLNSMIEGVHCYEKIGRPSLICASELQQHCYALNTLIFNNEESWLSQDIPEVQEVHEITEAEFYFIKFNLGKERYCENLIKVKEIVINRVEIDFTQTKEIDVRGTKVPVLPNQEKCSFIILIGKRLDNSIGIPVKTININDIFLSPLGKSCHRSEKNQKVRESWKSQDGKTIDFLNLNLS